jgi:3-oxoacyl-[acyl-carrier-protein] synthase-3
MLRSRIIGTGRSIPPICVTNDDLSKLMDTSDEWIQQRTGISTRYWTPDEVGPLELAVEASNKAIAAAGIKNDDIEMIVVASLSPQHEFPGTSAFLNGALGLPGVPAMDVRCQCTGFLYALSVADSFIRSGSYKRILVVGTEVHSTGIDVSTRGRDVSVLFGDGAGALVLEATEEDRGILSTHLHADGRYAKALWIEFPSSKLHPVRMTKDMFDDGRIFPQMDGRLVFKHAVVRLPQIIKEALQFNKLSLEEIDHFLFHQANLRINEMVTSSMGIPAPKVHNNIQKYGNTSAAAIPIVLDELIEMGRIEEGHLLCMAGFGSGFTWASILLRW